MEYDLEELLTSSHATATSGGHQHHTSSVVTAAAESSSSSLSDSTSFLTSFFKQPPQQAAALASMRGPSASQLSPQAIACALSEANSAVMSSMPAATTATMPNSCSLIFSTAASFNINQQDTVVYARESIRLLAKSLATYSEQNLFRQLYAYAPDNLAWLWAFFDWDTPVDLSQVPCQDTYRPFGWCDEDVISAAASGLTDDQLAQITRIFAESPLIQYKYRQELMIGDFYKFIEHVQDNVTYRPVAISLFVLYFPRFAPLINNPLKKFLNPKILTANLALIRELDSMLVKLISTRYSNIAEYKQRIFAGPRGLPTYVSSVLKEMNFWSCGTTANRLLMSMLTSGMSTEAVASLQGADYIQRMFQNLDLSSTSSLTRSPAAVAATNNSQSIEDLLKTLNYLRLLKKSNKVNCHLDYDSFDEKNGNISSHETSNEEEQAQMDDGNGTNTPVPFHPFSATRLTCMSPPPAAAGASSRILMNTPQTPSSYLASSYQAADYWPKATNLRSSNLTPPPSASKTGQEASFYADAAFNTAEVPPPPPTTTTCDVVAPSQPISNRSMFVSSPIPRQQPRYQEFSSSNYTGPVLGKPPTGYSRKQAAPSAFNFINTDEFSSPPNGVEFAATAASPQHQLNVNTNLSTAAIYSPVGGRSPRDHVQMMMSPAVYSSAASMANSKQWSGRLPPKTYPANAIYSRKVFLGGLPWDLNQNTLVQTLFKYGSVRLEVPGKDSKHPRVSNMARGGGGGGGQFERMSPGYVYVIFDHESAVTRLLADCRKENRNGGEHYYFNIFIPPLSCNDPRSINGAYMSHHKRGKLKEVEVIPWNQEDSSFVTSFGNDAPPLKIESALTVFVGGLHGMCNAQGLATFMAEVFGECVHASLDVDKYKYPIGSGRVTFSSRHSYVKAIMAHFVNVKANQDPFDPSPKFEKNIQIEPYLDDCKCSRCESKAQLFCRNPNCLENFCMQCWTFRHDQSTYGEHIGLSRQNRHNHAY